jgi:hypothetical protein
MLTSVTFTNKSDLNDLIKIMLKVSLNTHNMKRYENKYTPETGDTKILSPELK